MSIFAGTEFYQAPKCERCEQLMDECQCEPLPPEAKPPEKQTARIQAEKRKRGKTVTVIRGLAEGHPEPHFSNLLKQLKNHLGAGGTISEDFIEIQGNHIERIETFLKELGFRTKTS